jgi:hypothetical protein
MSRLTTQEMVITNGENRIINKYCANQKVKKKGKKKQRTYVTSKT